MNFAVYFAIFCLPEERAVGQCPAFRIYPVIDPDNPGQIFSGNVPARAPFFTGERYGNMLQDVLPVTIHPWDNIFNNAFLAPPPFLAASAALDTGLV
jgi:hypothetical protein